MSGLSVVGLAGCIGSASDHSDDGHGHGGENTTEADQGGSSHGHGNQLGEPVDEATVSMVTKDGGYHFEPHIVRVNVDGTVTFSLDSGTHSTTAYASDNDKPQRIPDDATAWDSGTMTKQGETFEHTFETEGVYDYCCKPHESLGMIGSVVVGDPAVDGEPGLAKPQSSLPSEAQSKIQSLNEQVTDSLE